MVGTDRYVVVQVLGQKRSRRQVDGGGYPITEMSCQVRSGAFFTTTPHSWSDRPIPNEGTMLYAVTNVTLAYFAASETEGVLTWLGRMLTRMSQVRAV